MQGAARSGRVRQHVLQTARRSCLRAAPSNRLVQAAARWRQGVEVRSMALRVTSILRIRTTRASLGGLALARRRW